MYDKIDEMLEKPCYVADIFPERIERGKIEQYFDVEQYFLRNGEKTVLYRKFAAILLKLNCYFDFDVEFNGIWKRNPESAELAELIMQCRDSDFYINIIIEESLFVIGGGFLHMSLYGLSERLMDMTRRLAASEGIFLRKA